MLLVNNLDFYSGMGVLSFMRDIGRHARLNAMLSKESVQSRLGGGRAADRDEGGAAPPESGLSFTEFSYQLFQAYDYWLLHQTHGCVLQIGGSDQWGNITAGIELIRRKLQEGGTNAPPAGGRAPAHGMTVPLLTTADGAKFGKSAGNVSVWLDEGLTRHHTLYQYLLQTADADVPRLLRLITLLPDEEIDAVLAEHSEAPQLKRAQIRLADAVTEVVRGTQAVQVARRCAAVLYAGSAAWASPPPVSASVGAAESRGGAAADSGSPGPDAVAGAGATAPARAFAAADLLALAEAGDLPCVRVARAALHGMPLADLLAAAGLAASKNEARRTLSGGGVQINARKAAPVAEHMLEQRTAPSAAAAESAAAADTVVAASAAAADAPIHKRGAGVAQSLKPAASSGAALVFDSACLLDGTVCLLSVGSKRRVVVIAA
jgi:tyrosyl-tRNA synthetase